MEIGMLWFDNDQKADLQKKVKRAAAYYRDKYGKVPNLCWVHPGMVLRKGEKPTGEEGEKFIVDRVEIRMSKTMLPHHFWIGVAQDDHSH